MAMHNPFGPACDLGRHAPLMQHQSSPHSRLAGHCRYPPLIRLSSLLSNDFKFFIVHSFSCKTNVMNYVVGNYLLLKKTCLSFYKVIFSPFTGKIYRIPEVFFSFSCFLIFSMLSSTGFRWVMIIGTFFSFPG